jgi:hypothetical protein
MRGELELVTVLTLALHRTCMRFDFDAGLFDSRAFHRFASRFFLACRLSLRRFFRHADTLGVLFRIDASANDRDLSCPRRVLFGGDPLVFELQELAE